MDKIYLADDEKDIREILSVFLRNDGYDVTAFETGDLLFERFMEAPCDLVLLDIMMPGTNGMDILTKLRAVSRVPVIILTAKDTDENHYSSLAMGSDDYITKPFKPMLLSAKIKAILRRVHYEQDNSGSEYEEEDICRGNFIYSPSRHKIIVNQQEVNMTPTEMKFLSYMCRRMDAAVSKDEILEAVWGIDSQLETRVADETNRRIRKKLAAAGSDIYVGTVWGYGFKMVKKGE